MVTDSEDDDGESGEAAYERGARSASVNAADKKPVDLLPFKTAEGTLVYDRSRSARAAAAAAVPGVSVVDDLLSEATGVQPPSSEEGAGSPFEQEDDVAERLAASRAASASGKCDTSEHQCA